MLCWAPTLHLHKLNAVCKRSSRYVMQANTLLMEFGSVLVQLLGGVTSTLSSFGALNYTSNFSCPTDGTAGGIKGPSIGQLTASVTMDPAFYSWVGCNCSNGGNDRNYTISDTGRRLILSKCAEHSLKCSCMCVSAHDVIEMG